MEPDRDVNNYYEFDKIKSVDDEWKINKIKKEGRRKTQKNAKKVRIIILLVCDNNETNS